MQQWDVQNKNTSSFSCYPYMLPPIQANISNLKLNILYCYTILNFVWILKAVTGGDTHVSKFSTYWFYISLLWGKLSAPLVRGRLQQPALKITRSNRHILCFLLTEGRRPVFRRFSSFHILSDVPWLLILASTQIVRQTLTMLLCPKDWVGSTQPLCL